MFYEIRVRGHLDSTWSAWFDGLTLTTLPNGDTVLAGPIADQAALHDVLTKVRDLALPLVAVSQVMADGAEADRASPQIAETEPTSCA